LALTNIEGVVFVKPVKEIFIRMYYKVIRLLSALRTAIRFSVFGNGHLYNISFLGRLKVALQLLFAAKCLHRNSATAFEEQLVLVNSIFAISPEDRGKLAEFGCYKGASSIALSIAAKLTARKLIIFDSFEGLPVPDRNVHDFEGKAIDYKRGEFKGSLDEVRNNIERYGAIEVVEIVKGCFQDTLPNRPKNEIYSFIFEDADLVSSVKDVIRFFWPRLSSGGRFFCHEARNLEVVQIFFDSKFWESSMGLTAPGLIGAGFGLPLIPQFCQDTDNESIIFNFGSYLGYAVKR
jgi:precorrin-6B methylase 2